METGVDSVIVATHHTKRVCHTINKILLEKEILALLDTLIVFQIFYRPRATRRLRKIFWNPGTWSKSIRV